MDADGTDVKSVTTPHSGIQYPPWSPKDDKVLYRKASPIYELAMVDVNDSSETSLGFDGVFPSWSPDGKYIAFQVSVGLGDEDDSYIYGVTIQGK